MGNEPPLIPFHVDLKRLHCRFLSMHHQKQPVMNMADNTGTKRLKKFKSHPRWAHASDICSWHEVDDSVSTSRRGPRQSHIPYTISKSHPHPHRHLRAPYKNAIERQLSREPVNSWHGHGHGHGPGPKWRLLAGTHLSGLGEKGQWKRVWGWKADCLTACLPALGKLRWGQDALHLIKSWALFLKCCRGICRSRSSSATATCNMLHIAKEVAGRAHWGAKSAGPK